MEYWVDGVLKHSLYNEVLISLGKREVGNAVDAPWKYTVEVSDATNSASLDDRDVSVIYDATGSLLILGEPGSGKTTTLLDLARTLLERAREDIKERVPVVLNLSSWKKKKPLMEWISSELSKRYRIPRTIAHFWLQHDYLLPLLDGLDEIETVMQPDCVAAINAFIEEFKPSGLVVCCRLDEYRWLPKRLKLNGAICLQALSSEEVRKYLTAGGPKLASLRQAVNTDQVLQELAQTPLMLSIMSLACQGAGGDELASQKEDSPEQRRKQIFFLYVEQMFQRKGKTFLVFPKEKIIGWLSWLARQMRKHSESEFLVEGLQPSWLGTRSERAAYGTVVALSLGLLFGLSYGLGYDRSYGLSVGLSTLIGVALGCWAESPVRNGIICGSIGGLIVGLIFGLGYWLLYGLVDGLRQGLIGGLICGLMVGLIGGLGAGSLNHINLVETIRWKWNQFWKRMIPGSIVGLIVGLIVLLIVGLSSALHLETTSLLIVGLIVGLIFAFIGGLGSGLVGGFTDGVNVGKAFPNHGIKLSLRNSLAPFLVAWSIFGVIGTRFAGVSNGLIAGLIVGLNRGGSAVIKHYALRLILWRSGYIPFKFIKFLDHCAKLILLKKVGGGYIFIHRMLLDYFADLPIQAASSNVPTASERTDDFDRSRPIVP